ncbi:Heparan-alpha-glucosaminide N-acetyltransferase [Ananas comosus]|uniref:Heparan-alpha-glucosaminide N-acetyltransferase n=1 Tax=Ananas comosus TaxID=4615 RepID=A0A199V3U2_ANACO|nr:Heparan-alpha-glucosaminide N-acetyltransferase [Ananas comosus]
MAGYVPLSGGDPETEAIAEAGADPPKPKPSRSPRLASLDAFRGLSIALMIFVDYAGSIVPIVAHSPWNGVRLADFVMPFFLFIAGVSLSLVYKRVSNKFQATQKAIARAVKLFLLGVLLQGGYLHGINTLTFGVDIEKVRWLGILQRIAIGYLIAALCEIWLSSKKNDMRGGVFKDYYLHWAVILLLSGIYLGLLYGLYVPDWQFRVQETTLNSSIDDGYVLKTVKCGVRGDLGPACNSAGMIDRLVLGIEHLYKKPVYRNLKECAAFQDSQDLDTLPSWCLAPFDPEGILGSLMAAVTCIIGLQYGHILVHFEVDVYGHRWTTFVFEHMGRHSLSIFILVPSNVAIILIQGFYWRSPNNNLVHWVVSFFVHK